MVGKLKYEQFDVEKSEKDYVVGIDSSESLSRESERRQNVSKTRSCGQLILITLLTFLLWMVIFAFIGFLPIQPYNSYSSSSCGKQQAAIFNTPATQAAAAGPGVSISFAQVLL